MQQLTMKSMHVVAVDPVIDLTINSYCSHCFCCPQQGYDTLQEFASERELCWHLCITLGLARQHERLAEALAQTGINEKSQPSEYRAQAQVAPVLCNRPQIKGSRGMRGGGGQGTFCTAFMHQIDAVA